MQKIQFSHTQVPRRPCSPEPHNYVLWHFLDSFCLLQCVKWHKCLSWSEKGSNVNDCKKWGTSGGGGGWRGTQLYNQWTRHTVWLIKHSGPPATSTAAVKICVNQKNCRVAFNAQKCVGESKKYIDHVPQAEIYLGYMLRRGAQIWCPRCNLWTKPEVVERTIHHSYSPQRPQQTSTAQKFLVVPMHY